MVQKAQMKPLLSELPWFELVINKDGSIAECNEHCKAKDDRGRSRYYVQALNKADAIKVWAARYDRELQRAKNRRLAHLDNGLCKCGRSRIPNKRSCANCIANGQNTAKARVAQGNCARCNHPRGTNGTESRCRYCADREALRTAGEPLPPTRPIANSKPIKKNKSPAEKADAYIKKRARCNVNRTSYTSLRCYRAALAAFDLMSPSGYREWLVNQITTQQSKVDEALIK